MKNDLTSFLSMLGIAPDEPTPVVPSFPLRNLMGLTPPPESSRIPSLLGSPIPAMPSLVSLASLVGAPAMQPALPSFPPSSGIRYGKTWFSEPTRIGSEWLPTRPGIYAILVFDAQGDPRPFRVLYFGKAENLSARVITSHEKHGEWCRAGNGAASLYVAYHAMENSADWQRSELERGLIKEYAPPCNDTHNPLYGLLGF